MLLRGRRLETSLRSGISLAQVGEFSFVLAAVGLDLGLFAGNDYQVFLTAAALSLMATPFLIGSSHRASEAVGRALRATLWRGHRAEAARGGGGELNALRDHAVVVGYGVAGRYLARMLQAAGITCVVIDQNAVLVRQAHDDGLSAVYGDGARHAMLEQVGCARARIVVYAISSPVEERRGVMAAREVAPAATIVVRTRYVRAIDDLMRLGADEVVVEEFEASLELFARALRSYEIPARRIALRAERGARRALRPAPRHRGARPDPRCTAASRHPRRAGAGGSRSRLDGGWGERPHPRPPPCDRRHPGGGGARRRPHLPPRPTRSGIGREIPPWWSAIPKPWNVPAALFRRDVPMP